jgi:hypothetical protein
MNITLLLEKALNALDVFGLHLFITGCPTTTAAY